MEEWTPGRVRSLPLWSKALLKYWIVVAGTGAIRYLMIRGLLAAQPFGGRLGPVSAEIPAETLLFFANFAAQRRFVFGSHNAVPASR